jgi:medium-chain acyl-CoA synthetase
MQLEPGKMYWNISDLGTSELRSLLVDLYSHLVIVGWGNCGASFFVHDDRSSFKPTRLLATLHKYPITTLCAPPTAYRQLVVPECQNYLTFHPPQALEHSTGAGEPLNDSVITTWQKVTGVEIHDGYGQSETLVICANMKGNKIKPGSMGKRLPGVPMFIIDSQGEECAVGVEGDIAISRTKNDFFGLFDGYLRRDGTLDPSVEKRGGHPWHVTGDRGVKDGDGYFWFVSRSDDLINSSGYRIGSFFSHCNQRISIADSLQGHSKSSQFSSCIRQLLRVQSYHLRTQQEAKSSRRSSFLTQSMQRN